IPLMVSARWWEPNDDANWGTRAGDTGDRRRRCRGGGQRRGRGGSRTAVQARMVGIQAAQAGSRRPDRDGLHLLLGDLRGVPRAVLERLLQRGLCVRTATTAALPR